MRLNLNLASQPYVDVRRFMRRWGLVFAVAAVLSAILMWSAAIAVKNWRQLDRQRKELRARIAERDQQRVQAAAFMAKPENRDTRDRSQFLNELIARKAFSWTQVFSDLEKIMPPGLHVVALTPAVNADNQLELQMQVNGNSRDRAIEMVRRLEESPHFTLAQVRTEQLARAENQPGTVVGADRVQFLISAIYIPPFQRGK